MSTLIERLEGLIANWRKATKGISADGEGQALEKPFFWAIETAGGDWHDGEYCVFGDERSARDQVENLNEELPEAEWYRVVPLYRAAAPSLHKEGLLEALFRIPFKEIEGIKWVRQLEVVRELRLCDESKMKPGSVNSAINSTSVQDGQDVRILPVEDTTLSPLLPSDEWESLSSESRMKLRKWFDLAAKYLQEILDQPAALHKEGAGGDAERIAQLEASIKCAAAEERRDCEKALLALAGWYPTPAETYGFNTSWAISDLCRAIQQLRATSPPLPLQRTLPDEQFKGVVVEAIGERRKLSLSEVIIEHWFNGYTLCSCKHEKFDIPMEELAQKYSAVNRYVFEAEQHRAYAEHIADIFEKLGAASPAGRAEQAAKDGEN